MKSKTKRSTLIFDGNHFFFKTLYVLPRYSKKEKFLSQKTDRVAFIRKMSLDFAAEIRKFSSVIDRVVFTVDSPSWRKDYYPQKEYKGNRSPDETIDWNAFYETVNEFKEVLKAKGVVLHQVPGAEGDDLVFAWSTFLNLKGENAIIISGDQDLMQLVGYNKSTDSYTIFYTNTNKKFVVYEDFLNWLNSNEGDDVTSIFDMKKLVYGNTRTKRMFIDLIEKNGLNKIIIDSDVFSFKKILQGDRGDNIMSAYWYTITSKPNEKGETKTRTYGISEKKAEKVLEEFERRNGKFNVLYFFEKSYREEIVDIIIDLLKATKMTRDQIISNMESNIMMMLLHSKAIPEEIQLVMFKNIEKMYLLERISVSEISSRDNILEGTDYKDVEYVPSQYDFFKGEDDTLDEDFIKDTGLF